MDVITHANQESGLLESLQAQQVSDLYTYRLTANAPNGSKNIVSVSTSDSLGLGNNISFNLPKFGLLERAVLITDFTSDTQEITGNCANYADAGSKMFSDITLRAHSLIICSANPQYNYIRTRQAPSEVAVTLSYLQTPIHATSSSVVSFTTGGQVMRVCTPLWLPFFEKPTNYLDLDFCEQLQVNATINSLAQLGLTITPTFQSVKLWCFFRILSNEARRAYQAKNFNPERPLNMLIYDQYSETAVCTASNSNSITLKVPHAVFASHAYISPTTMLGTPSRNITALNYSMSGRTIFETVPQQVFKYDQSFYGVSCISVSTSSTVVYATGLNAAGGSAPSTGVNVPPVSVFWGESSDRTWNSHAVAMSNVNNPIITVNGLMTATDTLNVVHEYYKLVSISPDDGRLTVGFSI